MSALSPKAETCGALTHVRLVPIADVSAPLQNPGLSGIVQRQINAVAEISVASPLPKIQGTEEMTYTGGCSCGSVRFAIDDYLYVLACHCQACKKRTGSAFGVSVVVDNAKVTSLQGVTKTFTRTAESGRSVDYEFCPNCGSTIRWGIKAAPHRKIFAGGAIDGMDHLTVAGEMYTETAIPWARLGCELSRSGEPDNDFRAALIEKSKQLR